MVMANSPTPRRFIAMTMLALAAPIAVRTPALAAPVQEEDGDEPSPAAGSEPRWKFEGGAGAAYRPQRRGDSSYLFSPFPIARLSYGDRFEASTRDGLSYALFAGEAFRFGPEIEIDRKERQAARRFGPLATTFGTGGAGVFVEWKLPAETRARLDLTEGVFGREGFRAVLSGTQSFVITEPLSLDLGFKTTAGDRRYVSSAYGVPENRRMALLPNFAPAPGLRRGNAGVAAIGPTFGLGYAATATDALGANLEVSRAVGTASHAPAVRAQGTRNALSLELSWRRTLYESN